MCAVINYECRNRAMRGQGTQGKGKQRWKRKGNACDLKAEMGTV